MTAAYPRDSDLNDRRDRHSKLVLDWPEGYAVHHWEYEEDDELFVFSFIADRGEWVCGRMLIHSLAEWYHSTSGYVTAAKHLKEA